MESIKLAIKYVFKEKGWENKVLPIYIAFFIIMVISFVIALFIQLPIEVMLDTLSLNTSEKSMLEGLSAILSNSASLLSLPVLFYVYGYMIPVARNIANGATTVLLDHKDILNTFVRGLKLYISLFIATLPTTVIGVSLFLVTFIGGLSIMESTIITTMPQIFSSLLILLSFVIIILIGILNIVISYASMYVYYQTFSFRKAIKLRAIFNVLRLHEKSLFKILLKLAGLGLLQFALSVFSLLLLCLAPFVFPLITTIGYFAKTHIFASTFKVMSNLESK